MSLHPPVELLMIWFSMLCKVLLLSAQVLGIFAVEEYCLHKFDYIRFGNLLPRSNPLEQSNTFAVLP